jgi:quinoprotein dehydrogenase-associated probable ABC transporter substrate-binding protein
MRKRHASVRARISGARAVTVGLALAMAAGGGASAQQLPDLVTPETLRVCADPANLPFSSQNGEGFESRIAEIVANELKVRVRYYWLPQGPGFVRNTLGLRLCDLIIGYAAGTELTQHSNPYYRSVFTLFVRRDGPLAGVKQLSDPRLKDKRIGVPAGTPPADHLADLGLIGQTKTYSLMVDRRYESPADEMLADLLGGRIDAAILWGPTGGPLAKGRPDIESVPLIHEKERPPLAFRITMAMRPDELEWKRTINNILRRREAEIVKVLLDSGVPLLDEEGNLVQAETRKP